jgi:predicted acetyltransferase
MFLTKPTTLYKASFLEALREFQDDGEVAQYSLRYVTSDFDSYVRSLNRSYDRSIQPPDYVPATRYWLIEDQQQPNGIYIGNVTVRHELNDFLLKVAGHIGYQIRPSQRCQGYGKQILALGLQKAREIGITRALITCDETNIGSKKVIEYNGGQLENSVYVEGSPVKKLRYWIDIA